MSPERFQHLNSLTSPYLTKRCWNRKPISAELRLIITLRYLATGDSHMSQAFNFVVAPQTVGKIVRETCQVLWQVLQDYMKSPTAVDHWKAIAAGFHQDWDLPNILGALDGKHVRIQNPKGGGSDYYNYKSFYSINLMALCDSAYRFLFVDIGSYGRDNDAAVFGRSALFDGFESNTLNRPSSDVVRGFELPYAIIGDEIFPLKPWLLKPYPGRNLTEAQAIFNYRLSRARRTIENAFGILTSKWRIFRTPINGNTDLVELIVQAATSLHNYLLLTENSKYLPTGFVDSYDQSGELIAGQWRNEPSGEGVVNLPPQGLGRIGENAKAARDKFCQYVNSAEGSVPWQITRIRDAGRIEL